MAEYSPSILETYREGAVGMIQANEDFYREELGDAALSERYKAIEDMTPTQLTLMTFRNKLFSAFLITPVVAIILRKKPK